MDPVQTPVVGKSLLWMPDARAGYEPEVVLERERQVKMLERALAETQRTYGKRLVRAEMLANAEMQDQADGTERPTGITYALHADAPLAPLARGLAQLGGTVSAYRLGPKSHTWLVEARRRLHSLSDLMGTAAESRDTISEHLSESHRVYDSSFLEGRQVVSRRARVPHPYHPGTFDLQALDELGPNASIGLYTVTRMSQSQHTQN